MTAVATHGRDPSGWRIMVYALAIWPLTIAQQPLLLAVPYYATVFGLSLPMLGAWLTVGRIFDVVADVSVAYLSDRFRHRIGRRPWVVAGLILFPPSMWLLFVPPASGMSMARFATGLFCFFLSWTMAFIPYLVHGTELATAPAKRAAINVMQGAVNSFALIASNALPWLFTAPSLAPWRQGIGAWLADTKLRFGASVATMLQAPAASGVATYGTIMLVIVLATSIVAPIMAVAYASLVPDRSSELPEEKGASALAAFANPVFLRFGIGYLLVASGYFIALFTLPLQLTFRFLRVDLLLPLALTMTVTQIVVAPLWYLLLARFERRTCLTLAGVVQAAAMLLFSVTPMGQPAMLFLSCCAFGLSGQTLMMAPFLVASEAADYARWKTGTDSRAVHVSLISLMIKVGTIMGALFLSLAGIAGIEAMRAVQTPAALWWLQLLSFWTPGLLMIVGTIVIATYPISRNRHRAIERRIQRRVATA